ncbi:MAG: hypothetical protein Q9179_003505, partial [Wetmoreana sp. 5 TL-2023]
MVSYFTSKRAKSPALKPSSTSAPLSSARDIEEPVLTEEDQAFLHRIATEGTPPPLPERPPPLPTRPQDLPVAGEAENNDMQLVLAQGVPLPSAPETPTEEVATAIESEAQTESKNKGKHKGGSSKKPFRWSFMKRDSRDSKRKAQTATATDLQDVAEALKAADAEPNEEHVVSDPEAKKEEEEMTAIMDDLNLAAVNNRVFSLSKESKDLLHKCVIPFPPDRCGLDGLANRIGLTGNDRFTLVLKDLMNGVPTAYDDLESLLTNSEGQLEKGYTKLPSFLQDLVKKLPSKMTQSIGPEVLAAAAEKHGMPHSKYVGKGAHAAEKMGVKLLVPSLKDLVTKP